MDEKMIETKEYSLEEIVEILIEYAVINLDLDLRDKTYIRNVLLHEFNLSEPCLETIDLSFAKSLDTVKPIYDMILKIDDDFDDFKFERIMAILSPRQSDIIDKFDLLLKDSSSKATDYFYNLMIKNNYIRLSDIRRNIKWDYVNENNNLEITINLSKPEKSNKDIAKLKNAISTSYPKCRLCLENVGFYGGGDYPARSNIRVYPMKLNNENWFMQYSPYAYYNEHVIVINNEHVPMNTTKRTIDLELDFIDQLPNYFIGCNSDLPIVGGSLLNHEHFQGGKHNMPMMNSKVRYNLKRKDMADVEISYLDWYNSCFLLKSKDKRSISNVCDLIIKYFRNYSDPKIDLIASDENGIHNAITTIARKVDGYYLVYMILRNNRCNNEYPDGIFHAHKEYHNIKSEGIGLIEAMGLFILPGRLKNELNLIAEIMSDSNYSISEMIEKHKELEKHLNFINKLVIKYGKRNDIEDAKEIIKFEVGKICEEILRNTGIFKDDLNGQSALFRFFNELSFEVKDE